MIKTQRKRILDSQVIEYLNCPQRVLKWAHTTRGAGELNMLVAGVLRRLKTSKNHLPLSIFNRMAHKALAKESKLRNVDSQLLIQALQEPFRNEFSTGGTLPIITIGILQVEGLLGYITSLNGFNRLIMPVEITNRELDKYSPAILIRIAAAVNLEVPNISEVMGISIDKNMEIHSYIIPVGRELAEECLLFTSELVKQLSLFNSKLYNRAYCKQCKHSPDKERALPCLDLD